MLPLQSKSILQPITILNPVVMLSIPTKGLWRESTVLPTAAIARHHGPDCLFWHWAVQTLLQAPQQGQ